MRLPRRSKEELQQIQRQIEKHRLLDVRRRRLYNRKYRKSLFFIAVWIGRIAYCLLFFIVLFLHNKPAESRLEIVLSRNIEFYKSGPHPRTDISIETNYGKYSSSINSYYRRNFEVGDTLLIERNIFRKAAFFTKAGWGEKYMITINVVLYLIVLIATSLSFFFNDGLDPFTDRLLLIIWALNIIAAFCYFLY